MPPVPEHSAIVTCKVRRRKKPKCRSSNTTSSRIPEALLRCVALLSTKWRRRKSKRSSMKKVSPVTSESRLRCMPALVTLLGLTVSLAISPTAYLSPNLSPQVQFANDVQETVAVVPRQVQLKLVPAVSPPASVVGGQGIIMASLSGSHEMSLLKESCPLYGSFMGSRGPPLMFRAVGSTVRSSGESSGNALRMCCMSGSVGALSTDSYLPIVWTSLITYLLLATYLSSHTNLTHDKLIFLCSGGRNVAEPYTPPKE